MKKKSGLILLILAVLAAGALWTGARRPGFREGLEVMKSLKAAAAQETLGGALCLTLGDGQRFSGTWSCHNWLGKPFLVLSGGGYTLYYYDNILLLENGRGYDLSCWTEELPRLRERDLWLLPLAGIAAETQGERRSYRLNLEQAGHPELSLCLETEAGTISALSAESTEGWQVSLTLDRETPPEIPVPVLMASRGNYPSVETLEPLISACLGLAKEETLSGEIALSLDCGLVILEETGTLVCDGLGIVLRRPEKGDKTLVSTPIRPGEAALGLGLLCAGAGTPVEDGFLLEISPETAKGLMEQALPELGSLSPEFSGGSLRVILEGQRIAALALEVSGSVDFFSITIPLALSAVLTPAE